MLQGTEEVGLVELVPAMKTVNIRVRRAKELLGQSDLLRIGCELIDALLTKCVPFLSGTHTYTHTHETHTRHTRHLLYPINHSLTLPYECFCDVDFVTS